MILAMLDEHRTPGELQQRLLAQAERSVAEKSAHYPRSLRAALAQPLDMRPDPSLVAGVAWPEAVRTARIDGEPPIASSRPVVGPGVRFVKRLIRRSLRWYLQPVVEQVNRHNAAVIDVLGAHNREILELRREVERLRRRVAELEEEHEAPGGTRTA